MSRRPRPGVMVAATLVLLGVASPAVAQDDEWADADECTLFVLVAWHPPATLARGQLKLAKTNRILRRNERRCCAGFWWVLVMVWLIAY